MIIPNIIPIYSASTFSKLGLSERASCQGALCHSQEQRPRNYSRLQLEFVEQSHKNEIEDINMFRYISICFACTQCTASPDISCLIGEDRVHREASELQCTRPGQAKMSPRDTVSQLLSDVKIDQVHSPVRVPWKVFAVGSFEVYHPTLGKLLNQRTRSKRL